MPKNIEMNYKDSSGYEVLYPNVRADNMIDFSMENSILNTSTASLFGLSGDNAIPDKVF